MAPKTGTAGTDPAFDVVRFTRIAARQRSRREHRYRDVLVDVYSTGLGLAVVLMMLGSLIFAVRTHLVLELGTASSATVTIPQEYLPAGLTVAGLLAVALFSRKIGPVNVRRTEGFWWLGLPVGRRRMVEGSFLRRVLLLCLGAAVVYLPFSVLTFLTAQPLGHALASATFGLAAASVMLLSAIRQVPGLSQGPVPTLVLSLATSALPSVASAGLYWPAVVLMAAVLGLWLLVAAKLGSIPGADLSRGGAVAGHAGSAVFFMDVNELTRAFSGTPGSGSVSTFRRLYALPAARPWTALLLADATAFLRHTTQWHTLVALLALGLAVMMADGGLVLPARLAVLLAAGCAAASAVGVVAKRTAITPGVDAALPLHPAAVRLSRMVLPALALSFWMGCLAGGLVLLGLADPALLVPGAIAGLGMGAAAVRGAYRRAPDWSRPPVETPFGPVPSAQLRSFTAGIDTVVIAMAPVLLALYVGQVPGILVVAQLVASTLAVLMAAFSR